MYAVEEPPSDTIFALRTYCVCGHLVFLHEDANGCCMACSIKDGNVRATPCPCNVVRPKQ